MDVLISPTDTFNLDQPTSKLIDNKICVYDYSDKEYQDFYFKKISTFISYRYPTVSLMVGSKYRIELPLNWRILVTNEHEQVCRLVPIEDLIHFENQIPVFSPFHPGLPKILDVELVSINANPIEHFVPKTPKVDFLYQIEQPSDITIEETKDTICFSEGAGSVSFADSNVIYIKQSLCDEKTLTIRNRKKFDRIYLGNGHKSVKNLMIDDKIPCFLRDSVPILLLNDEIVWVCGIRDNPAFRPKNGEAYIKITYSKENANE